MTAWDGRPQNPERDGWHWCVPSKPGCLPLACFWIARDSVWQDGPITQVPSDVAAHRWRHLGPCLTPAEVAAAVMAEREACQAVVACMVSGWSIAGADECSEAIRARPAPAGSDALAAALAQARREGIEAAAARIHPTNPESDWTDYARDMAEAAQRIRALLPAPDADGGTHE